MLARPGFSTADKVTDLSGRGVGVDAVYTRVRALCGAMDIRSTPGQGSTFRVFFPVSHEDLSPEDVRREEGAAEPKGGGDPDSSAGA